MKKRPNPIPEYFGVHHTASDDDSTTPEDIVAERKRRNEGYNGIIDTCPDGITRYVQDVPDDEISNGTWGVNSIIWNVAIDGNSNESVTPHEIDMLVQVLAVKMKKYGYKKKDVWRIITHQYAGLHISKPKYFTECPGKRIIALMPSIRNRVAKYLPE